MTYTIELVVVCGSVGGYLIVCDDLFYLLEK